MKLVNRFLGLGPNLILDGESPEQAPFLNHKRNGLALGRPVGRHVFKLWRDCCLSLGQQTRSADHDAFAVYSCLCSATRQRLEVRGI